MERETALDALLAEERAETRRREGAELDLEIEDSLEGFYRLIDQHHALWSAHCVCEELRMQRGEGKARATVPEIEAVIRQKWAPEWREEIKATYRTLAKRGMARDAAVTEAYRAVCRLRSIARVGQLPEINWP